MGKSLLGNAIPTYLASSSYFQCKIHNRAKESSNELKRYIRELRAAGEGENIFDLFAVENRCGRWCSQGGAIYSLMGVCSVNIFNCRELILDWIRVPRKLRVNKAIHRHIFLHNDANLLNFPFNPSEERHKFLKENWVLFYIATYIKQFLISKEVV